MNKIAGNIPKWVEKRYTILAESFGERPFTLDQATAVLKEKNQDESKGIAVYLSELRKAGWMTVEPDPEDNRRKRYTLKPTKAIVSGALKVTDKKLTRSDIESVLKRAADLIRTRVDYKFILVLLFLKRISDKWQINYDTAYREALADGLSEKDAAREAKNAAFHDFDIPEEYQWDAIRREPDKLPEKFSRALKALADRNPEFRDMLDNVDFIQFATNRENAELLRQLVELFSEKRLHHVGPDILGDAYEWILRYFAPQKAKEGEVYTPREVIALLVEMLQPQPGDSVYDPVSASNGMLIEAHNYVVRKHGAKAAARLFLFGQEANPKTLTLGKMNLYIHDIKNAQLMQGDTLLYPKFKTGAGVKRFSLTLANPPWNQDGYDEEALKKGEFWRQRFPYGFPPNQSADWAWVQHMLASVDEKRGRVGLIIDNGCLFRGGKERAIRQATLDADLIEAVILLPEKLFYNTSAPGAVMIFNHGKAKARQGKVLFINASREFARHPDVRKLNILNREHLEDIAGAYLKWKEREGFARIVPRAEIAKNDDNLNVTLYPQDPVEEIDLGKEWRELRELDAAAAAIDQKLEGYLKELGAL